MTIGMLPVHQIVRSIGHAAALRRIAKALDDFPDIAEVGVERDVVLIGLQDIVIPAAQKDLASACPGGVKMPGRNTFRVVWAWVLVAKEPSLYLFEIDQIVMHCFVLYRQRLQQRLEPFLHFERKAPACGMN